MESGVSGPRPREGIFCLGIVEGRKNPGCSEWDDLHHGIVLQFRCSGMICVKINIEFPMVCDLI
jgi:hypothetical protein